MLVGEGAPNIVVRFPANATDHTSPLDVPTGPRHNLPQTRVVIITEAHGARDAMYRFGGLRQLDKFHIAIYDEAQMFGSPCYSVLL